MNPDPPPPYTRLPRASIIPGGSSPFSSPAASSSHIPKVSRLHFFHRRIPLRKTSVPTLRNETTQAFRRGRNLLSSLLDRAHRGETLSTSHYTRDLNSLSALAEELADFGVRYHSTRASLEQSRIRRNVREELDLVRKTLIVLEEIVTQYERLLNLYQEKGPWALARMRMPSSMWDEDEKKYPKEW